MARVYLFASLRRFAIKETVGAPRGPAFAGADPRRHEALDRAVADGRALAGLLDVPWSPPTYERLIGKVIAAVEDHEGPLPK
jgi:hypothetical protein